MKDYQEHYNKLEAENEKLKEEINEYKKHSKCAWKCFEGTLCEEGEKYKTTLQEIKGIAKDNLIGCFADKCDLASEILQVITKAESEG